MPVAELRVGDVVLVRGGEKIPVDGAVDRWRRKRQRSVDLRRKPADREERGLLRASGHLRRVRELSTSATEKVGRETMFARIIALVESAEEHQAPVQKLADRVSAWLIPLVFVFLLAVYFVTRRRAQDRYAPHLHLAGGARPGDTARDDRRDRPRGEERNPGQGRRVPRVAREGGRYGLRQDGHSDRRASRRCDDSVLWRRPGERGDPCAGRSRGPALRTSTREGGRRACPRGEDRSSRTERLRDAAGTRRASDGRRAGGARRKRGAARGERRLDPGASRAVGDGRLRRCGRPGPRPDRAGRTSFGPAHGRRSRASRRRA